MADTWPSSILRTVMPARRHARGRSTPRWLVAVVLLGILISACSPAEPSPKTTVVPSPGASGSISPDASSAVTPTRPPVAPAKWTDCGSGFQCANLRVPKDYADPAKGTLQLALLRLPATDRSQRIGSLIINPGGPGGSGVDFVRDGASQFPSAIRKQFDLVGFDPRGVNTSSPVRCIDNLDLQADLDPSPDNAAELSALVDQAHQYADACAKRNAAVLPYLSTAAVVDDLDTIRAAVGDEKLSYFGFSYGTLIGSMYADKYPDKIRAMVLDGALDPQLSEVQLRTGQAKAFERRADALPQQLREALVVRVPRGRQDGQGVRRADGQDRQEAAADPAHRRRGARWGPGSPSRRSSARSTTGRTTPPSRRSSRSPRPGTAGSSSCCPTRSAGGSPTAPTRTRATPTSRTPAWTSRSRPTSPTTRPSPRPSARSRRGSGRSPSTTCRARSGRSRRERTPAPATGAGAPPIVVIGSTGDPATPFQWARNLAAQLESGTLITRKGEGHTGYFFSNCVRKATDAYLLALTVPKKNLVCK